LLAIAPRLNQPIRQESLQSAEPASVSSFVSAPFTVVIDPH
jgi:hypothetical protein